MKTVNCPLVLLVLSALTCRAFGAECGPNKRLSTSKLICYYSTVEEIEGCYCTHVILPANSDVKGIERAKERAKGVKIYVTVNEFNQGLINLLKTSKVDGLELDLKKLDSKNDISDFISTVKSKLGSDLDIALSVPSKADLVAKYFDFKALSKHVDFFILQTAFLGASANVTFHPSRLSGMWDMQNTDSVVDLVNGLGAPLAKLAITAPVQAFQFKLQNSEYTAPGSPALELKSITRNELCKLMHRNKNWTIERDEDQAGPYIFSKNQWISFEDSKSMDIKAKYSRVRGLAGMALKDLAQDGGADCGSSILEAAYNGLSRQARAPRGAVLHSLEREIVDSSTKPLDSVQLSPYKISRIIDTEGKIHVIRQDSRTEFQCSRQGYFVHPRSCNRFYRCVKFNQLSEDYNVFEFDCPAGLAFDERVEVCVWPGSLPHGTPCSGSSEIAPVPRERFVCPSEPGYYADPENCRWFFACLDHGKSPLSAYEFRCPFGLVFDGDRLVCEWPWLVPKCASGIGVGLDSEYYYGGLGDGNAIKDSQSSGLILHNYNGLGALGTVKLGGLSGHFEKPVAAVYSNVGAGSLGLGYQNSGGYIEGGGLSYKAALSLQNAGLLKVNNGVGYQAVGHGDQSSVYATNGAVYSQYEGANSYAGGQLEASAGLHGTANLYQGANVHLTDAENNQGAVSTQSFTQYHDAGGQAATLTGSGGYQGAVYVSNEEGHGANTANGFYAQGQVADIGYENAGAVNAHGSSAFVHAGGNEFANKESDFGVKFQGVTQGGSQSFTHFHGEQQSQNGAGIAGSINIIGGGYSAVGTLSGVDVSNNGENADVKTVSTTDSPTLVSVTNIPGSKIASVPTVTAVPVPGIKTVAGFETIRGGVIANIPELQYKVKSLEDAGLFANFSNSFANFVVTSPATERQEGHFNTVAISTARPFVSVTAGQPQVYVSSTVKPLTVVEQKVPEGYVYSKPAVSTVTFQKYDANGDYRRFVEFEDKRQDDAYSTPSPTVVVQHQPQIVVSSTPASPTVSSYSYAQDVNANQGGYVYNQPSVYFEEKPENPKIISKFTIRKPVEQQTGATGGYYYEKPSVQFEEKPVVVQQPTILNEIPTVQLKHKTVVEDYTYQQPPVVTQYYYQQPSARKQPIVPLYQQPELLSTYTYQPPLQKQPVSTYTYQNVVQQAAGIQKPAQSYAYQSSKGTNYQYVNFGNKHEGQPVNVQSQGGYVYSKPSIAFEESPQAAIDAYQYSTPKPVAVTGYFNTGTENEVQKERVRYEYPKPAVAFVDTPVVYSTSKPVVKVEAPTQPAVATSYFNVASSKANAESSAQQAQVGYSYPKPSVHFEETPVTYSTPQPFVVQQPVTPVSSYFNFASLKANSESHEQQQSVGYSYPKPALEFEERPVIYSTPKPVVVQPVEAVKPAVVTSYFNIANSKANAESHEQQQSVGYSYPKPALEFEERPVIYSTPKPVVVQPVEAVKPAVVTSYFNIANSKANVDSHVQQQSVGYTYPKPALEFEERPVIYSTPKPVVVQPVEAVKPAVATSYFNFASSKANSESHEQQQSVGYSYPKPALEFEERPVIYSTPKPVVVQPVEAVKPAVATNYFNFASSKANSESHEQQQSVGYSYPKPALEFEERPVIYSTPKPVVVQPVEAVKPAVVTSYFNIANSKANAESHEQQQSVGYSYPKPALEFEERPVIYSTPKPVVVQPVEAVKPAVVTSYFNIANSKANVDSHVQQQSVGYTYPKPALEFEERPVIYSTPKPVVVQPVEAVKPAVATSYFNFASSKANSESHEQQQSVGYSYPKPALEFEERPVIYSTPKPVVVQPVEAVKPAVATNYFNFASSKANSESHEQQQSVGYSYPKPALEFEERPVIYSTPKPIVVQPVEAVKPGVVTSYFNFASSKGDAESHEQQQSVDYSYPKPSVQFEETPVIYSTPKPVVVRPAVVTSYFNVGGSKGSSEAVVEQQNVGYDYPKPAVSFEETYSTPKPAVVHSYFNIKSSTPQTVTYSTPKPISVQPVVSSYVNFGGSTAKPEVYVQEEKVSYAYEQPEAKFEEGSVFYSTPKPAAVSSYNYVGSTTPQPNVVVEEDKHGPAVFTSYFNQQPSTGYEYPKPSVAFEDRQPVQEEPFVKKTAYVTGQYQQNSQENYDYQQTGKVVVENYQFPEYEKVKQAVFGEKIYHQQPQVALDYVQSTPKPTFISAISAIARKKVQPVTPAAVTVYDSRYASTPASYVSSTIAPEVHVIGTTSRPVSKFSFSSLDDQYQYNDVVKSTTADPVRTYLPVTSTVRITSALPKVTKVVEQFIAPVEVTAPAREYLPVRIRTKAPAREYLPVEVSTPSIEYLPAPIKEYWPSRRVKVTSTTLTPEITTLGREYLPARTRVRVTTTGSPLEEKTYTIRPRRPSSVKIVRPVTVIKQNDAHPLLSAKLGAQCTCVSNTLKLRKNQKIIVVEDDDDDGDDGYVVDDGSQGKLIESYNYEPQRVVDITPTPEVYVSSSTVEPQAYVRKRVRVRPVAKQSYSDVSEIFLQKNTSPALVDYDSTPSDKEIAKAVRTGLKLVKQAAKQGAEEGTSEALAKHFDRYGPGGVRSRTETLQGTIDCQRAGLFRHPTECNKFYACRWDCTKNRFTLHVFNCPVHLTFDNTLGACNWPSQGPACVENTLITSD